ncbi:MAG: multidrug ABC transporter permease/ATP-binding protein [Neisseriaceae bacterium]|nr:multidrug ABC transporter permease/ATP-binding protein [Neisseriaceae bacterium]
MNVVNLMLAQHKRAVVAVLILSILASLMGVGVLMFINGYLLHSTENLSLVLLSFIALLVVYLGLTTWAQISLTTLGHRCVYDLRRQLLKQIMDTDLVQIQALGKAKIMASLANDIRSVSYAFVRLPELLQGGLFILCASVYLCYLSPGLFLVTCLWLVATLGGGHWAVKKVYAHLNVMRAKEDQLYQHYESALDGHKELALNQARAARFYEHEFSADTQAHLHHIIRADNHHAFAGNWTNVMMLGAVGVIFYLTVFQGWASIQDATTIALTVLFIRTPLLTAVGAFPTLIQGQVSLQALAKLKLRPFEPEFQTTASLPHDWQQIHLQQLTYAYPASEGEPGFTLQPLDFTLKRGETVFLVGANGSGKSTLSMLLTGLYAPSSGQVWVDDVAINDGHRSAYRQLFSAVFVDFYLFRDLLDGEGMPADTELIEAWLQHLRMDKKAKISAGQLLETDLSQGQRKRLALLVAAIERRSVLVLDEWAADQDPHFRKVFYEQLLPLLKAQGHTVFAISHDDKYFHHADRVVQMAQGVLSPFPDAQSGIHVNF